MLAKVQIPSLVNIMLTRYWEELNVIKECAIVVVFISHENKHLAQWWKKCRELHHGSLCACCHVCNIKGGYP